MTENHNGVSRRDFFKIAGLATGAGVLSAAPAAAQAAGKPSSDPSSHPWWVKEVDRPTLSETNDQFKRFSGASIFALYKKLKNDQEGAGAAEAEEKDKAARIAKWMREGKPGYGLRDRAIYDAAYTLHRSLSPGAGIMSWTRARVQTPQEMGVEPYRASPEEAANTIKAAARLFGAASVGIAPMNEKYVNLKEGNRDISFEDVDAPKVDEKKMVIPTKMKWVIAIAVQMDLDLIKYAPTALGAGAASLGYSHCSMVVTSLAEYIRELGYQAIPSVNDTAQSVPFANDAGLGEMSRLNRLITPAFGPGVRLCKVFTDLPMAYDRPISFGVLEFCKNCMKCADACPSKALSFDRDPSFEVKGPWNNPGHKAWYEDSYKCYQYWQESTTGCSICFAVCPYTKADKAWIHEMVKATTSVAPAAVPLFRTLDDAFGYDTHKNPEEWWKRDMPAFGIYSTKGTGR